MIKSVDSERIRRCVNAYAKDLLASHPEVEEVIVFGSFAKGTYAPGSDVDIFLLLSRSNEKRVRDRIPRYLPGAFPVGLDLFPVTREEIEAVGRSPWLREIQKSSWRFKRSG